MKRKSENQEIIDLIMKKRREDLKSGKDVSSLFSSLYGDLIQALLEGEMEDFIGYEKGTHEDKKHVGRGMDIYTGNRRNGYSSKGKKVKTETGEITIDMPRDRDGKFEPEIIKKRQRILEGMDDKVIMMYSKGMSLTDIRETIKDLYNIELSNQTLSTLTATVSEKISKWQNRRLKECYPFVYVDCLYCKRRISKCKKSSICDVRNRYRRKKRSNRNMD